MLGFFDPFFGRGDGPGVFTKAKISHLQLGKVLCCVPPPVGGSALVLLPAQVLAIMGRLIISIAKGSIKTNKKRDKKKMSIYHEKIGGV